MKLQVRTFLFGRVLCPKYLFYFSNFSTKCWAFQQHHRKRRNIVKMQLYKAIYKITSCSAKRLKKMACILRCFSSRKCNSIKKSYLHLYHPWKLEMSWQCHNYTHASTIIQHRLYPKCESLVLQKGIEIIRIQRRGK